MPPTPFPKPRVSEVGNLCPILEKELSPPVLSHRCEEFSPCFPDLGQSWQYAYLGKRGAKEYEEEDGDRYGKIRGSAQGLGHLEPGWGDWRGPWLPNGQTVLTLRIVATANPSSHTPIPPWRDIHCISTLGNGKTEALRDEIGPQNNNEHPSPPCPGGSDGKESTCDAGETASIPGLGRSPGEGNGNPLQHSCLENPTDRETWWAIVHVVAKIRTWLSD